MTMEIEANLDHPLVEIACRLMLPDAQSEWCFDDEAYDLLRRAILSQKADPELPSAIFGLFQVATELQATHGATEAAGRLFCLLGELGPALFPITVSDGLDMLITNAKAFQEKFGPPRTLPLEHGQEPPEGTVSARAFRGSPGRRRRR
jgi:hypothetical protein